MGDISVSRLEVTEVEWLESEFNARWAWPREAGFVAALIDSCPHFVARDGSGRYLGHCHVRQAHHVPFVERGIPGIADLNVMPDSRRLGAATTMLDAAEAHIASASTSRTFLARRRAVRLGASVETGSGIVVHATTAA